MKNPLRHLFQQASSSALAEVETRERDDVKPVPTEESGTNNNNNDSKDDVVLDTVIIGAGWAGLGAAMDLYKKQLKDKTFQFCILEGASHIGGRSHTVSAPSNNNNKDMVELGSQWVHGVHRRRNKVYQLALQHDMMVHYDKGDDDWQTGAAAVFVDQDTDSKETTTQRMEEADLDAKLLTGRQGFYSFLYRYPSIQKKEWRKQHGKNTNSQPPAVSVLDVYKIYCQERNLTPQDRRYLYFLLDMDLSQEYSASLEDIDGTYWDHDKEFSGGDLHFGFLPSKVDRGTVPGGYSALINKFAAPLLSSNDDNSAMIRCNCTVTSIDYTSVPVVIEYTATRKEHPNNGDHTTPQQQNYRILAHSVVCTVPLGVLKADTIQFNPQLSAAKQDAISKLGMGTYNKVVLFWNPNQRSQLPWLFPLNQPRQESDETGNQTRRIWMERIHAPSKEQDAWSCCYTAHTHHSSCDNDNDAPIRLYFFLAGRKAREIESLTNEQTQQQAMTALRDWFDNPDIPDPQHIMVSRWYHDPFAKGSYSYYQVGSSPTDRRELAKPDPNNRLFFAGEACHIKYYATTHGALMTGQDNAKLVWKEYVKRCRNNKKKNKT